MFIIKKSWKKIGMTFLASSSLLLVACGNEAVSSSDSQENLVDGEELTIAHVPWETEIASSYVLGGVLQDLGYDVELSSTDLAVAFEAVASGQADTTTSVWMPESQADLWKEHEENFTHIGTSMEGARVGLAVPTYMEDVNSIEDLTNQSEKEIVGIEAGAGVVQGAKQAVQEYDNLEGWGVTTSSAGALTTELGSAVENQEEIVVTGWSPHWKFLTYDLKYLEDPQNVFGQEETIETIGRLGLEEEQPVAYSVLENFHWDVSDMEEVMLDMEEGASPEQAASNWIEENPEHVAEWTTEAKEIADTQN